LRSIGRKKEKNAENCAMTYVIIGYTSFYDKSIMVVNGQRVFLETRR
jgi:hypothetical protein